VFVNAGNPLLMALSEGINRWTFGRNEGVKTRCTAYQAEPELSVGYEHQGRNYEVQTSLLGDYNYENVMAAVCIGLYMGIAPETLNRALSAYVPANNRSQLVHTTKNTVFLDAYNANPSSMRAAIDNFHNIKAKRKALILGDMLELGDDSEPEHEELIAYVDSLGFTEVILIGPVFVKVNRQGHYPAFGDAAAALAHLKKNPFSDTHVLLKGSRGLAVEVMMEAL
jgi:UDP-N-acetylmuramoyl-tripeptide--D-alanyl-D-alanine ligase